MFKPTVHVIKKMPVAVKKTPISAIPLVGSSAEVDKEITKYCDEIDKEVFHISNKALKKSYNLTDGVFIYAEGKDGYYQFPNHQFLNFAPDTGAVFKLGTATHYGYISYL